MKNFIKHTFMAIFALAFVYFIGLSYSFAYAVTDATLYGYNLDEDYFVGDSIDISDAKIKAGGEYKETYYKTIFPDGSVIAESSINLTVEGKYKIFYYTDGAEYSFVKTFTVKNHLYTIENGLGEVRYEVNENTISGAKGLTVTLNQGAVFKYNKVIDLSKNSAFKEFISVYFITKEIDTEKPKADYTQFFIRLTDVYDEENYILITCQSSYWTNQNCYVSAAATDQTRVGLENGVARRNNDYGFLTHTSFFGMTFGSKTLEESALKLYFDYDELKLLGKPGFDGQSNLVTDFDDPILYSDIWSGFTTGEVYLSLYTGKNVSAKGSFVLLNVNGDDLSLEAAVDEVAPNIIVDDSGNDIVPYALKDVPYPLYLATAMDGCAGYTPVNAKVYYGYQSSSQKEYVVQNGKFIPDNLGVYTVVYSSVDFFGNVAYRTYKIECVSSVSEINIILSDSGEKLISDNKGHSAVKGKVTNGSVGNPVYISDFVVNGGTGHLNSSVEVFSYKGEKFEIFDGYFIPPYTGEYIVKYTVTDYIGCKKELSYEVTVSESDGPAFDDCSFPLKYVFSNRPTSLPVMYSYDYICGQKIAASEEIKAYDQNKNEIRVDGHTLYPDVSDGEKITLVYTTSTVHGKTNKSFTVTAIEPTSNKINVNEYFVVTKGDIITVSKDESIETKFSQDSAFEWMFPLVADSFDFALTPETVKFDKISFWLTDSKYENEKLKLTFYSGETCSFSLNDSELISLKNVSFIDGTDSQIGFTISTLGKTVEIYNGGGTIELSLNNYINGDVFKGFTSGKVHFETEFEGVKGESQVNLYTLCGQPLKNLSYDILKPRVKFLDQVEYYKTEKAEKVSTVIAVAGDVLDGFVNFSLTAYAPDGSILKDIYGKEIKDVSPAYAYEYYLTSYGRYILKYTAEDWSGNEFVLTCNVTLYDTDKPTLMIEKAVSDEISVGEDLYIPLVKASDNVSKDVEVYVYIRTPSNILVKIDRNVYDSYKVNEKGTYYLTYVCYDEAGNMAMQEYQVKVE